MKALIFAAGLGTRLRPITDSIPKALVPVGGRPMLERVIRRLRGAGISEFVVNACHLKEQIIDFLADTELGVKVSVSVENGAEPLETGGGIKHAEPLLRSCCCEAPGRFLVHNVDILSNLDVEWFLGRDKAACAQSPTLATLLLTETTADRYLLFDGQMCLKGWTNVRTGEVKSPFPGFDPAGYRRYSFCGIHVISDEVFSLMKDWPERFSIIDFYLKAAADHRICGVVADNLKLIDIGSPEKLAQAEAEIADFSQIF